jgi:hypothetical protein
MEYRKEEEISVKKEYEFNFRKVTEKSFWNIQIRGIKQAVAYKIQISREFNARESLVTYTRLFKQQIILHVKLYIRTCVYK